MNMAAYRDGFFVFQRVWLDPAQVDSVILREAAYGCPALIGTTCDVCPQILDLKRFVYLKLLDLLDDTK